MQSRQQPQPARAPDQDADRRPWTVIVRDGRVLNRYRAEETHATAPGAMPASLGADAIEVWEVDPRLPEPPAEGQPVDPRGLTWTQVWDGTCPDDGTDGGCVRRIGD